MRTVKEGRLGDEMDSFPITEQSYSSEDVTKSSNCLS